MNNSKTIGNIGEAVAIAEFNGKLNKIQVKTSEKIKDGTITWGIKSLTGTKGNYKVHYYDSSEIDYFALYNVETGLLLLVPITEISARTTISFTYPFKPCKHTKQHNWQDYIMDEIINIKEHVNNRSNTRKVPTDS